VRTPSIRVSAHLPAAISELEMYEHWRGLMMPYEIETLEKEGLVADGRITELGVAQREKEERMKKAGSKRVKKSRKKKDAAKT